MSGTIATVLDVAFVVFVVGGCFFGWRFGLAGTKVAQEVKRLRLQKGDLVLLRCKGPLSKAQAERIRDQFAGLTEHNKVVVLDQGLDVDVLEAEEVAQLRDGSRPPSDPGKPGDPARFF